MMGHTEAHAISRFVDEIPADLVEDAQNQDSATRRRAAVATGVPAGGYRVGDRLRHPRFGWGTLVSQRGSGDDLELTIAFSGGGIRSFLAKYAQLGREQEQSSG